MRLPHNCRVVNIHRGVSGDLYAQLVSPGGRVLYSGTLAAIVILLNGSEFERVEENLGF